MEAIADMHVHTAHSVGDCTCPMERYLQRIARGDAREIGFAEHYHPHLDLWPEGASEPPFDHAAYRWEIAAAQNRGFLIHGGIEVTYDPRPQVMERCREQLRRWRYAYAIGSVHLIGRVSVSRSTFYEEVERPEEVPGILAAYYRDCQAILRDPGFTVLGHVDVYKRNLPPDHPMLRTHRDLIQTGMEETARAAAQSGTILEINTSGLSRPQKAYMPGREFLALYRRLGGERICLGSDAHDAKDLARSFDDARAFARSLGFSHLFYPWAPEYAVAL